MTRRTTALLTITAALILAAGANPADAGGHVGVAVSNHGLSVGFGGSSWGIWGSSWSTASWSVGFSASLSGYGEWVRVAGLGRVWRPWVAAGWQPYSHGKWVWTSLGWTWVAYEPWGWIPHHYGNWAYSTVGWVWTPGYTYHPGNVVWVSSGAYLGWYPCAPAGWSHGHRAYHHGWNNGYGWGHHDGYRQGYNDGWRDARYATWVPRSHVTTDNVAAHRVGHEVATRSVARSRVTPLPSAPSKTEIERVVGRSVPETSVSVRTARIDGRETSIVRPDGQRSAVERHGGETVRTALTPTASDRATGRSASTKRSVGRSEAPVRRYPVSQAPEAENGRDRAIRVSPLGSNPRTGSPQREATTRSRASASMQSVSLDRRHPVSSQPTTRSAQPNDRSPKITAVSNHHQTQARKEVSIAERPRPATRAVRSTEPRRTVTTEQQNNGDEKTRTRKRKSGPDPSKNPATDKPKRSRRTRD